ncbi:MAG TPA: OmpA family protein [Malonomonas sp.]
MKLLQNLLLSFAVIALVASCAPPMQPRLQSLDSGSAGAAGGKYIPKVDNFQVILDASLSMDEGGKNDYLSARNIASRINQGIPTDLNYIAGLRSVGHSSYQSKNSSDLLYGMTSYTRAGFHDALGKIKYVGGPTPMAAALQAAGNDLKSASGKSALIVISDGLNMDDALAAAKSVKGMFGDKLCIYTIAVGKENNGAGQDLMKSLADAGQCGLATTDTALANDANMADFINTVFLAPKPAAPAPVAVAPLDSDGDGVTDDKDQCPNTPKGAPVNSVGCPLDSDGDGVYDYLDQCPDTPKGVSVDSRGCPTALTLRINFKHDSSVVAEQYLGDIAKAAKCINEYPGNKVFVEGHTDSQGTSEYNQGLSERRAAAVVKTLVEQYDIPASRLTARGFGEDRPVADNTSNEGRYANRRVEVACGAAK